MCAGGRTALGVHRRRFARALRSGEGNRKKKRGDSWTIFSLCLRIVTEEQDHPPCGGGIFLRFSERTFPCSGIARAIGAITRMAAQVEIDPFRISSTRSGVRVFKRHNRVETQPCVRPTMEAILSLRSLSFSYRRVSILLSAVFSSFGTASVASMRWVNSGDIPPAAVP